MKDLKNKKTAAAVFKSVFPQNEIVQVVARKQFNREKYIYNLMI
jgi:hypothetical protein